MRILITGGAGFIGSHLAENLLERNHELLVIDNFSTGRRDNLNAIAGGIRLVEESIADTAKVAEVFADYSPEMVIHCAASYKNPENWTEDIRTNALGTANVVQSSVKAGVGRFIYFQTALCYGNFPKEQPVTLKSPLVPESSYAISKTAGENYIALSGLEFLSFRLANIYGPRNVSGPIPTFFSRLSSGKGCFVVNSRRDFVFVQDLVRILMQAVDGRGSRGYYHVSTGADYSIKEIYEAVTGAMGINTSAEERERGKDDAPTILLDPSKTYRDFDWKAETPLRDGIRAAVEWYGKNGVGETYTHLKLEK
ncbi:MAG: NAD-dependent epimerase/dehydratase family protein [Candidatus Glassbacteria bacterium]